MSNSRKNARFRSGHNEANASSQKQANASAFVSTEVPDYLPWAFSVLLGGPIVALPLLVKYLLKHFSKCESQKIPDFSMVYQTVGKIISMLSKEQHLTEAQIASVYAKLRKDNFFSREFFAEVTKAYNSGEGNAMFYYIYGSLRQYLLTKRTNFTTSSNQTIC